MFKIKRKLREIVSREREREFCWQINSAKKKWFLILHLHSSLKYVSEVRKFPLYSRLNQTWNGLLNYLLRRFNKRKLDEKEKQPTWFGKVFLAFKTASQSACQVKFEDVHLLWWRIPPIALHIFNCYCLSRLTCILSELLRTGTI